MPRIVPRIPLFRPLTRLGGFASRPLLPLTADFASPFRPPSTCPLRLSSGALQRNYFSSNANNDQPPPSPTLSDKLPENATLTQRLKYTMKKYGWYALGMYIFFSTLDFGLTFAAINYLGADYATQLVESIKAFLPSIFHGTDGDPSNPEISKPGHESLYAMLVLAYTIHKTLLLPFRVGLTAAFTPRFVKWLGKKGYSGSDGAKRAMTDARQRLRRNSSSSSGSQHGDP